ncbi:MAG: DUF2911 domain-containing protein [Flavobacteriales bacterium]|nr:DUF2911 domain-containing protein [Flavobacteriales bacterium]
MKGTLFTAAVLAASIATAQELPQASPLGEVEQTVGLTKIEVAYARPSVKGRTIFGDLVAYDKLWRTGANKNTTIEFSNPVKIGGTEVGGGKYSLFTVPGKDAWVIHLNKNTELWGEDGFKEEEIVASIKVKPASGEFVETLTFSFDNVVDDKADLVLSWEKTRVVIPINADATDQALANIKEAQAKGDMNYGSSARFCLDRNVMTKEALEWAQKGAEKDAKFWNLHTLARAQAANGMPKEALATAEQSMKMAQEAKNEAYVKMNRELIERVKKGGK